MRITHRPASKPALGAVWRRASAALRPMGRGGPRVGGKEPHANEN
jgi:hypothetical protein